MFRTDHEVPELCPVEFLLPQDSSYRSPVVLGDTGNVSPIELSWLIFSNETPRFLLQVKKILTLHDALSQHSKIHDQIDKGVFESHYLRTITAVALDSRRHNRVDLRKTYENTNRRLDEAMSLELFHHRFGLVERPDIA